MDRGTKFVIDNIRFVRALVEAQPAEKFNLNQWKSHRDCGTLYCAGGLLASKKLFGLRLVVYEYATGIELPQASEEGFEALALALGLPNEKYAQQLFDMAGCSMLDEGFDRYTADHKALFLHRCDRMIESLEAEA